LLPILWSSGTGSEVMRRIAVPMVGGMVSSTVLTLLVIPAIYALVKRWQISRMPLARRVAKRNAHSPAERTERIMMDHMGNMMWGIGLLWPLVVIVLVLAAAASATYLVSGRPSCPLSTVPV